MKSSFSIHSNPQVTEKWECDITCPPDLSALHEDIYQPIMNWIKPEPGKTEPDVDSDRLKQAMCAVLAYCPLLGGRICHDEGTERYYLKVHPSGSDPESNAEENASSHYDGEYERYGWAYAEVEDLDDAEVNVENVTMRNSFTYKSGLISRLDEIHERQFGTTFPRMAAEAINKPYMPLIYIIKTWNRSKTMCGVIFSFNHTLFDGNAMSTVIKHVAKTYADSAYLERNFVNLAAAKNNYLEEDEHERTDGSAPRRVMFSTAFEIMERFLIKELAKKEETFNLDQVPKDAPGMMDAKVIVGDPKPEGYTNYIYCVTNAQLDELKKYAARETGSMPGSMNDVLTAMFTPPRMKYGVILTNIRAYSKQMRLVKRCSDIKEGDKHTSTKANTPVPSVLPPLSTEDDEGMEDKQQEKKEKCGGDVVMNNTSEYDEVPENIIGNALEFVVIKGPSCDDTEGEEKIVDDSETTDAACKCCDETMGPETRTTHAPRGAGNPEWTHRHVRELIQSYFTAKDGESKCEVRRDIKIEDVVVFNSWIKICYLPEEFGGGLLSQDVIPLMKELMPVAARDWAQYGISSKDKIWLMTYLRKDESDVIKARFLKALPDFNLERDFIELDL